jgi:surface carbohydrate biosynthesis protein
MHSRSIILPVESHIRELDGKLLLACAAAARGWSVYLGAQTEIRAKLNTLPEGIFIAKGMAERNARFLRIADNLGMTNFAWDEEGLVHPAPEVYFIRRLSHQALPHLEGIFSWGPEYSRLFDKYPLPASVKLFETGNPRIDLLERNIRGYYHPAVEKLRREHGPFILLNSNFARINPLNPRKRDLILSTNQENAKLQKDWDENITYRKLLFEKFQDMFATIAKTFPKHKVILRPHPAELPDVWNKIAQNHPNAEVIQHGNVIPWLMATEILIQNGCTTAIESALLDKPVLAFQPISSEKNDWVLPLSLSTPAYSIESLVELVGNHLSKTSTLKVTPEHNAIIHGLLGDRKKLSCDEIIDVLEQGYTDSPFKGRKLSGHTGAWRWRAEKAIRAVSPRGVHTKAHQDQLFPITISTAELAARIELFDQVTHRFQNIAVEQIAHKIFRIFRMPQNTDGLRLQV